MQLPRRRFLRLAAGIVALSAGSRAVGAQAYPTRPVRIIVGFPAGGTPDLFARLLAESLSVRLGQSFVVENRPGAGGNIATEACLALAPADGYTLLVSSVPPNFINATLEPPTSISIWIRDIVPVAGIGRDPICHGGQPVDFPAKSVPEFIAYAKANPGKINMTSTGTGNLTHFSRRTFQDAGRRRHGSCAGAWRDGSPDRSAGPAVPRSCSTRSCRRWAMSRRGQIACALGDIRDACGRAA